MSAEMSPSGGSMALAWKVTAAPAVAESPLSGSLTVRIGGVFSSVLTVIVTSSKLVSGLGVTASVAVNFGT